MRTRTGSIPAGGSFTSIRTIVSGVRTFRLSRDSSCVGSRGQFEIGLVLGLGDPGSILGRGIFLPFFASADEMDEIEFPVLLWSFLKCQF